MDSTAARQAAAGRIGAGPRVTQALASHAERSLARQGRQADLVAARIRQHVLCQPQEEPRFRLGFRARFLFVLGYAFLTTYQAYYLLDKIGSAEADVPHQIFLGTLLQSVLVVAASLSGGKLSERADRWKIYVLTASITYGLALLVVAIASDLGADSGR